MEQDTKRQASYDGDAKEEEEEENVEIETKSTSTPPPPPPLMKRMISVSGDTSIIPEQFLEQVVHSINEMNIEGDFPCPPRVAACYAMFYLHVVGGHAYEDLTVDDVVNWFFGNGKDKDKTSWASGLPQGFKRTNDGFVGSPVKRTTSPIHEKRRGDNRILRVIAPTIRDWWWMYVLFFSCFSGDDAR